MIDPISLRFVYLRAYESRRLVLSFSGRDNVTIVWTIWVQIEMVVIGRNVCKSCNGAVCTNGCFGFVPDSITVMKLVPARVIRKVRIHIPGYFDLCTVHRNRITSCVRLVVIDSHGTCLTATCEGCSCIERTHDGQRKNLFEIGHVEHLTRLGMVCFGSNAGQHFKRRIGNENKRYPLN